MKRVISSILHWAFDHRFGRANEVHDGVWERQCFFRCGLVKWNADPEGTPFTVDDKSLEELKALAMLSLGRRLG